MKATAFLCAAALALSASAAIAASPDPVEQRAGGAWQEHVAAREALRDRDATLQAALQGLIDEIEALKKRQADTDAYWRQWCGSSPGCRPAAK